MRNARAAKERVFSFRDRQHRWDPRNQRPELWNNYNTWVHRGESIRVFPLSNWTELEIWQYIHLENVPLVPLYFAAPRPVVRREHDWIVVDDDRQVGHRHLEQATWSVLLAGTRTTATDTRRWEETMQWLAGRSFQAYRRLTQQPGFVDFFR